MTPYTARCEQCGEITSFARPPEEWQTRMGVQLRAMTPERRAQKMREMFRNMPCLGCGHEQLQMCEEA